MDQLHHHSTHYANNGTQSFTSDFKTKAFSAASTIERAYLSYRDRQMFILLKHAVRAAEQSWTFDILRKISPNEAALLNDPSVHARVRLRFGGREFPPIILFKIYLVSNRTTYLSGKKTIRPATNAAVDACKMMGHRRFYDQMIIDACQFEKDKITDVIDVTTVKDYMQYLSNMDETPSYLGGKENYWRQLSLEALPRQSIMYDIMQYLQTKSPSPRLQAEMPVLLSRPVTQEIQLEQFRAISRLPSPPNSAYPFRKPAPHPLLSDGASATQRRSVQSRRRVAKMKKIYAAEGQEEQEKEDFTVRPTSSHSPTNISSPSNLSHPATASRGPTSQSVGPPVPSAGKDFDAAPEDHEARALFEWTQDLNFDDINRGIFPESPARPDTTARSVSFSSRLTKRVYT